MIQEENMTIGELSKRTGLSTQTIHYYLKEGLLPDPVKTSKTWAYYTYDHVERINMIKNLKERYFFPLKVIKGIRGRGVFPSKISHGIPPSRLLQTYKKPR